MPAWIGSILGGFGSLVGAIANWWSNRQAQQHDAQVCTQQQTTDALEGESNALKQTDNVAAALDAGGVPIADDPNNRNR